MQIEKVESGDQGIDFRMYGTRDSTTLLLTFTLIQRPKSDHKEGCIVEQKVSFPVVPEEMRTGITGVITFTYTDTLWVELTTPEKSTYSLRWSETTQVFCGRLLSHESEE